MRAKDIFGLVLTIAGVVAASLGQLLHYKWFLLAVVLLIPGCLLLFNAYRSREFMRSGAGGLDIYDSAGLRHGGHGDSFSAADSHHSSDAGGFDGASD